MKSYEGVFIFPPEAAAETRKAQFKNLDDLLAKFQAEIVLKNEWGKRPLGYTVRKFNEGHFCVIDYKMDPAKAVEFRKALQLQEDVIKYMITLKNLMPDKRPPKPSKPARAQAAPGAGV